MQQSPQKWAKIRKIRNLSKVTQIFKKHDEIANLTVKLRTNDDKIEATKSLKIQQKGDQNAAHQIWLHGGETADLLKSS